MVISSDEFIPILSLTKIGLFPINVPESSVVWERAFVGTISVPSQACKHKADITVSTTPWILLVCPRL